MPLAFIAAALLPEPQAIPPQAAPTPVNIFDSANPTDPRALRRQKVKTIGSMPVIIGIAEWK